MQRSRRDNVRYGAKDIGDCIKGPFRGSNPGPPAPKAGIIPLDQTATMPSSTCILVDPKGIQIRRNEFHSRAIAGKNGEAGHRSQCLSHAKRALYHLSYIPDDGKLRLHLPVASASQSFP